MSIFMFYFYIVIMYIACFFAIISLPVVAYVFHSLGYQSIAKSRCIKHGWLSWLPVGVAWILGCISDQYQYVVKGKVTNRRKLLLWTNIGMLLAWLLFMIAYPIAKNASGDAYDILGAIFLVTGVSAFVFFALSVLSLIYYYMSLYDLYRSCDPDNSMLYLVLSILLSCLIPLFVFSCRKKELGMPPRKRPTPDPAEKPADN